MNHTKTNTKHHLTETANRLSSDDEPPGNRGHPAPTTASAPRLPVHGRKHSKLTAVLAGLAVALCALTILLATPPRRTAAESAPPTSVILSGSDATLATEAAYFNVGFTASDETFTIMLTDTARIQEARDILNGTQLQKIHVMGTIVKSPAYYNPSWSYHIAPASIEFFEVAIEVCDAAPEYVEEHLDEACGAFLPNCVWCPWSSVVVEEVHMSHLFTPVIMNGR